MIIKYNSQATFTSAAGITFNQGDEVEVQKELGETLINTFIGMFEDVTPAVKAETKPKAEPKAKAE